MGLKPALLNQETLCQSLRPMPQGLSYSRRHNRATIGLLPDSVLLEMFVLYAESGVLPYIRSHSQLELPREAWQWHRIAHVCQKWHRIVLSSPRRLKILLLCSNGKPVAKMLNYWPDLPIIIHYVHGWGRKVTEKDEDNITHALHKASIRVMGRRVLFKSTGSPS
ncbi:hypothetical protein BC834DRAFT_976497 [Gloeopeniophorella convolvens]|nr:hypothetical protein BC834DRAFT_976497 [Gloeopeniophorella convolvens]